MRGSAPGDEPTRGGRPSHGECRWVSGQEKWPFVVVLGVVPLPTVPMLALM